MIGDRDDLNRPLDANRPLDVRDDPYDPRETRTSRNGFGWGAAILAAILIVGGILLFASGDNRTTTASNSTSAPNAQSTPSPAVGKAAPPPATK